ncbi:Phytocyanin domain [Arabidopsis suecica]|uniref:Phytocyanin domain n=1 Tax=Arabidopsis suecica TaxID=45249 RepID=A0A8T2FFQ4_ARASU|nr:Phytocyanin domain [Arabidopsis suecica]
MSADKIALTISISSAQTVNNAHPDNNVLVEYDPSRSIPPPPPSKIYQVGDSKGWSVSQEKISRDLEFISCDPTSPVAMHKTGHDLVKLTKPGVHYFITSMTSQSEAELFFFVVVVVDILYRLIRRGRATHQGRKPITVPMFQQRRWNCHLWTASTDGYTPTGLNLITKHSLSVWLEI